MILVPAIAVAAFLGYCLGWSAAVKQAREELLAMVREHARDRD